MKNNFLIYVLSCFWLGFSPDAIGQNRYHEDSTRMTEDSSWCEPHYRDDGRVDNLIMVSFSYPLVLIRNNEPVTGIVYSIWPNGNVGTEKHYKNGLPVRHEKGYWSNGKLGNIIKYYSKQKIGYRTPKKEKEWFENGSFKSKEKNYYWGENGHFLLRKSRYPNGNLENKTRKWSNRKRYNLKEKLWHSNGQLKRILNSSRETCWDEEGNKIECD